MNLVEEEYEKEKVSHFFLIGSSMSMSHPYLFSLNLVG